MAGRRGDSCDTQSKSSQYVNLSQANEETLKKKKKEERKTNKKKELTHRYS